MKKYSILSILLLALTATTFAADKPAAKKPTADKKYEWQSIFDGKTLTGWKPTEFDKTKPKVSVEKNAIILDVGGDLTGITYDAKKKPLPRENYEIRFDGKRLAGEDFFATVTFPVGPKEYASFVTGGWGGTAIGISCIDGYDAIDNMTTEFITFKKDKWYQFRVRVSTHRIEVWIGDKQVVNQSRKDHKFAVRWEVEPSRPLGFCSWRTKGAVCNIELRELKKAEIPGPLEE